MNMQAMAIDDFGTLPTLHDLREPEPAEGEVRVRVEYASVNGFDLAVMSGATRAVMEHRFPIVLGKDFAGTVDEVGPGVIGVAVGDQVFGVIMKPALGDGTFGEMVTAPAAYLTAIPDGVDHQRAGALGLAGAAALSAVDAVAPAPGETVLISGATGGVGSLAVQLAAQRGAYVIATAHPGEEAFVRGLGAAATVDYSDDVVEAVIGMRPDGLHSVVHLAGDGLELADTLASGGRFASTVGLGPEHFAGRDLEAYAVMALPSTEVLDRLAADVATGRLIVPVHSVYPLKEVPQALQDFAGPKFGKFVIAVA